MNCLSWFLFLILEGGLLVILIDCMIFCQHSKNACINSFFPGTVKLWNSLSIECFPMTFDLNGFRSGISRHLLTVGSL